MTAHGHKVACLHSHLDNPGPARDAVIDAFRFGKAKVLITTNVLARGLDVATVSMVVNYDLPTDANNDPDPQTYLHRIGRTGRFGRVGVSISFVHNRQSWMDLCAIADYFNVPMLRVPADDIEVCAPSLYLKYRVKDMVNEECRKLRSSLRKFSRQDRRKRGMLWKSPVTPVRVVVVKTLIKVEKQQNC